VLDIIAADEGVEWLFHQALNKELVYELHQGSALEFRRCRSRRTERSFFKIDLELCLRQEALLEQASSWRQVPKLFVKAC
jgi:hypothetical protein